MENLLLFKEAASILTEGTDDSIMDVVHVLEDANSPITKRYREKLYQSIIDRAHVDFGDIPRSRGDISRYAGYKSMMETLNTLIALGKEESSKELTSYATTILAAIENIRKLKTVYAKGFTKKDEYVMLDYNIYTYLVIQATTSLISSFVNDIQTPSSQMKIVISNDKYHASLFYMQSLEKFNRVCKDGSYSKYLLTILEKGTENGVVVTGTIVGAAAVAAIALSIIPLTRTLIYRFKDLKRKLSETLAMQAYFLELNKNCIEYNNTMDPKKKKKILQRQEKVQKILLSLSDRFKVTDARAEKDSGKELQRDNRTMTMDNIHDEVSDSDITIV